jgi:hypothetical protein
MKNWGNHQWYQDSENAWVKSIPFYDTTASALLAWAKSNPLKDQRETAWVLDLDSTLFCLAPRIHNIFLEFLRAHPQPRPEWMKLLSVIDAKSQRYSIEETFRVLLRRFTVDEQTADQMAAELWQEFYPFWKDHFFEDRHLHYDVAYPGAADFVREIKNLGRKIVYLTGRDRLGSGQATRLHLRSSGFKLTENEVLVMKPKRHDDDVEFKRRASQMLSKQFHVELVLDNEPENLVMFADLFREARIVLYHTVMSGRVPQKNLMSYMGHRKPEKLNSFLG